MLFSLFKKTITLLYLHVCLMRIQYEVCPDIHLKEIPMDGMDINKAVFDPLT